MISIKGLDKAAVLKALYDHSHVQGMGFFAAVPEGYVTLEHCRELLSNTTYFDYLYGRVLKVNLDKDGFNEALYDRDNGPGAALRAINSIRGKQLEEVRGSLSIGCGNNVYVEFDHLCHSVRIHFKGIGALDVLIHEATRLRERMTEEAGVAEPIA